MEWRFLSGADSQYVNYGEIDADTDGRLDEHLAAQTAQDAEDAYFEDAGEDDGEEDAEQGTAGQQQVLGPDEFDY